MKTKLMALMLVASGAVFAETRFSIGVQIGRPAPVAVVNTYQPPCPGPGYVWVDGYYDEYNNWIDGYWALPPYAGRVLGGAADRERALLGRLLGRSSRHLPSGTPSGSSASGSASGLPRTRIRP